MKQTKLIVSDAKHTSKRQHTTPCSDCPWRRDSLPGWLGGADPVDFVRYGHNDRSYNCHVIVNQQCAGLAVYRSNVCKSVQEPNLKLPPNKALVFAWPIEFLQHHDRATPVSNLLNDFFRRDL